MNHINSFKIELVLYLKVDLMLYFLKHCFFFIYTLLTGTSLATVNCQMFICFLVIWLGCLLLFR